MKTNKVTPEDFKIVKKDRMEALSTKVDTSSDVGTENDGKVFQTSIILGKDEVLRPESAFTTKVMTVAAIKYHKI